MRPLRRSRIASGSLLCQGGSRDAIFASDCPLPKGTPIRPLYPTLLLLGLALLSACSSPSDPPEDDPPALEILSSLPDGDSIRLTETDSLEFRVEANVGRPRVAYKETVTRTGRAEVVFDRMLAGKPQYARVVLEVAPAADGESSRFVNLLRPQDLAAGYVEAVRAGALESLENGFLAGYPMVGVEIRLVDAEADESISSEIAFKAAAAQAFRQAVEAAAPVLLEPIMDVEVVVPEGFLGEVLGDLNARGADIRAMEPRAGGAQAIRAYVALAKMFGYATDLRSLTQGRGTFTMELHHYEPVDSRQMEAIVYGYSA